MRLDLSERERNQKVGRAPVGRDHAEVDPAGADLVLQRNSKLFGRGCRILVDLLYHVSRLHPDGRAPSLAAQAGHHQPLR